MTTTTTTIWNSQPLLRRRRRNCIRRAFCFLILGKHVPSSVSQKHIYIHKDNTVIISSNSYSYNKYDNKKIRQIQGHQQLLLSPPRFDAMADRSTAFLFLAFPNTQKHKDIQVCIDATKKETKVSHRSISKDHPRIHRQQQRRRTPKEYTKHDKPRPARTHVLVVRIRFYILLLKAGAVECQKGPKKESESTIYNTGSYRWNAHAVLFYNAVSSNVHVPAGDSNKHPSVHAWRGHDSFYPRDW